MDHTMFQTPEALREALHGIFTDEAVGGDKAVKMGALEARLPAFGKRSIRKAISELVRLNGLPIVSDSHVGYYRADKADELRRGERELKKRALSLLYRRKRLLDQGQHEVGGQMDLMRDSVQTEVAINLLGEE